MLNDAMRQAIVAAAQEVGLDPTIALAIAERESSFNPQARNSKTIRGLFQMRGDLRRQYGIGDSDDPYTQAKGWGTFFRDTKRQMAKTLGRDPSDAEGYLGHHFGSVRAARMMKMAPDTPVEAVFTPYEMSLNPHFSRAGTVGRLNSTILADIDKRQRRFGGSVEPLDFSSSARAADDFAAPPMQVAQAALDFSDSARAAEYQPQSMPPPTEGALDFSQSSRPA